ncbi:MAG: hypothetical protein LBD31_03100 [Treponema sp.]|jgi:hypothetical protein|nr:hypothetical protein [Treponema sp.]
MHFIDLTTLFRQNIYIFLIMGAVCAGALVFNIIRFTSMKSAGRAFLASHPGAAKIYIGGRAVSWGAVTVHSVDGETPVFFTEKIKTGFYVIPGSRMVEMSFTSSRPGIIYKTVTKTIGPVKKELITRPDTEYKLGFNDKEEIFTFEET